MVRRNPIRGREKLFIREPRVARASQPPGYLPLPLWGKRGPAAGVRPSPGAETDKRRKLSVSAKTCGESNLPAPGDGRTPRKLPWELEPALFLFRIQIQKRLGKREERKVILRPRL